MYKTVTSTFFLLTQVAGAGIGGGVCGFYWGQEALKGVRQPQSHLGRLRKRSPVPQTAPFLEEAEILQSVSQQMLIFQEAAANEKAEVERNAQLEASAQSPPSEPPTTPPASPGSLTNSNGEVP